jgi:hypothetical protein
LYMADVLLLLWHEFAAGSAFVERLSCRLQK